MTSTLERIQYGFDRDSRRTWRRRALTANEDNAYNYDGLSQVVRDARGNLNLNQTAIGAVPASQEGWDYDPTGNWRGYQTQADGSVTLDQHRVHDKGNRLTQIEGDPSPILLDRAGRMRQVPPDASGNWDESLELKWDAWGRITQVKRVSDNEVLGSYAYDGLTRRIIREVDSVEQHTYYSSAWRPVEERKDSETDASAQYLWGARHRDDLVRRDRDADDDGSLDETRYVLMDYYSPASIVDETGAVTERYAFSAFGFRRIMGPDWIPRTASECAFVFAFQGQFLDTESALLNFGYRYYSPYLGRWTRKDLVEEKGGVNLYAVVFNNAINQSDYLGLSVGVMVSPDAWPNCHIDTSRCCDCSLGELDAWIKDQESVIAAIEKYEARGNTLFPWDWQKVLGGFESAAKPGTWRSPEVMAACSCLQECIDDRESLLGSSFDTIRLFLTAYAAFGAIEKARSRRNITCFENAKRDKMKCKN